MMTEEQKAMIADIEKRISKLNEWEIQFIDNIKYLSLLSHKQGETLNKIWDRVTG